MTTFGDLHAGDVVQAPDGSGVWGVAFVQHAPFLGIVLVQGELQWAWQPDPATPVERVQAADMSAEAAAWQVMMQAGLGPEVLTESWER